MTRGDLVNFRLRGIPNDYQTKPDIHELIGSVLTIEAETNLEIHSLTINPNECTTRVATLTFDIIPSQLSDKTKDRWTFYLPRNTSSSETLCAPRGALVFDTHFQGFTPLQHTDQNNCQIDIVALSGLGGHAFGSFKERNGRSMWLRDSLAHDISIARILIYGYDTRLVQSSSFQNLVNLGRTLQADLKAIRATCQGRPIIFIGHSLGGLVIKGAIVKMKEESREEDYEILQSTSGFLFFGVPHEGMAIESLIPIVGNQPNRALLESLGRNSDVLHRLKEDFRRAFDAATPKIVSYFETEKSPTARKKGGKWELTGPLEVLVDHASAVCGSQDEHPINRSHSEMVKYVGFYDENYPRVRESLQRLVKGAKTSVHDSTSVRAPIFLSDQCQECIRSLSFVEQDQRCKEIRFESGTCEWLQDDWRYQSWMRKKLGLLWIKGNPGAGKTFLMKFAFTTMQRWAAGGLVVSFFFHGRGVPLQKEPVGLFRALLSSLLPLFPEFLSHPMVLFEDREKRSGPHSQGRWTWFESELQDILSQLLISGTKNKPVTIFVDALDECGKEPAKQLLSFFKSLLEDVTREGGQVKICFSSRHYPLLGLDTIPQIIVEEQNNKDIRSVIHKRLEEIQPIEQRHRFENDIMIKAQGGFQWAVLVSTRVMEDYTTGVRAGRISEQIRNTPQALEKLYAGILGAIPKEEEIQTTKLFRWVLFAKRPLLAQELRDALATDKDMVCTTISELRDHDDWTDTVERFERRVKHLSRGLVEFHTRELWEKYDPNGEDFNREAQFIHQSVPEFLQKRLSRHTGTLANFSFPAEPNHYEIFCSCLKYLLLPEVLAKSTASRQSLSAQFPLAPYAVRFFFDHFQAAESQALNKHDILQLIRWSPQSQIMEKLAGIWRILDPNHAHTPNGWPFMKATPLHVLVALGSMAAFMKYLQEDDIEVDGKDTDGNTPLMIATREGRHEMAQVLIGRFVKWKNCCQLGIDRIRGRSEDSTLRKSNFVDVNARNYDGDTPLTIAVIEKADNVIFALLDAGADLKYFDDAPALVTSTIQTRNKKLLMMLIENNVQLDGAIYFALALEGLHEDDEVLENYLSVLLTAGASMSKGTASDGDYHEEAIHLASRQGRTTIVELLLSHGASAAICNGLGETPLQIALQAGHEKTAEVLFRMAPTTVTVDALNMAMATGQDNLTKSFIQDGTFTSLQPTLEAFFRHHCTDDAGPNPEIVAIVTQKVLSMKARGLPLYAGSQTVESPLILATRHGLAEMARALCHYDTVCIDEVDSSGKTAFVYALEIENEELALHLVCERGASNAGVDAEGRSPLIVATMKGYDAVVEAILQHEGTSVNLVDNKGITAITYSILMCNHKVLEVFANWYPHLKESLDGWDELLQAWAEPDQALPFQLYKGGRTALMHSIILGQPSLTRMLAQAGTRFTLNLQDTDGKTALMHAVLGKNPEIIRILTKLRGPDILTDTVDKDGKTAFMHAAIGGYHDIVGILIEDGVANSSKNIVDANGKNALWYAIQAKDFRMSSILRNEGGMDITASLTFLEALSILGDTTTIDLFLWKLAGDQTPKRLSFSAPPGPAPLEARDYLLACLQRGVADRASDIAPITVATVFARERVVAFIISLGQVNEDLALEALNIAEAFGFEEIAVILRRHVRQERLPSFVTGSLVAA